MYFSGEIVSYLGIPVVPVAPGSAVAWWFGLIVWIILVVSVEDYWTVKVDGKDEEVEKVVSGEWP